MSYIQKELNFAATTSAKEAQNTIYNATLTSPDRKYLVLVAGKLIKVVSKSGDKCFIDADDLPRSVIKVAVGNKYLAVLLDSPSTVYYTISTFELSNCAHFETYSRDAMNITLSNLTTRQYNLSGCNGDL